MFLVCFFHFIIDQPVPLFVWCSFLLSFATFRSSRALLLTVFRSALWGTSLHSFSHYFSSSARYLAYLIQKPLVHFRHSFFVPS
ncbi:hypothetical protein QBC47DRAFT_391731 [Echria macrotheca]|uniref:Uncharacterized protein n=1 Tax=Echria macrotheca TaxID=438768 RepID=A0AAJ0B4H2_9PEZI|nr:hypothetical protein QBC47DRAFT_391731 [Echria macrotheca]